MGELGPSIMALQVDRPRRQNYDPASLRERSTTMQTEKDLHEAMRDEFVEGPQFLVRREDCSRIARTISTTACFQGVSCLMNNRIGEGLSCHFPEGDKAIHSRRETHPKDSIVAGRARRLVIEIKGALVAVRAQKDQHVQPVQWVHQANRNIHVYQITATACNQAVCPAAAPAAGYVERSVTVTVAKCKDPTAAAPDFECGP